MNIGDKSEMLRWIGFSLVECKDLCIFSLANISVENEKKEGKYIYIDDFLLNSKK